MLKIEGATAFVSGAAGGIGLAIAEALLGEGARVALADIDMPELARAAHRLGPGAMAVRLDVADRASWASARAEVEAAFGPVEILVNNAGVGPDGHYLAEMKPEIWDRTVAINLTGIFNGINCFGAGLAARRRGHIVNTASMAGLSPIPRLGAYTATKFAVVGMSEALRGEMAEYGVGVSILCPGFVRTRLAETTARAGIERTSLPQSTSQQGLDPQVIGALVIQGIVENRPMIVSHGEYRPLIEKRARRLAAAFDGVPVRTAGEAG